jgi:hypothetical protein
MPMPLITDAQFTKKDLVKFGIDKNKIFVVPLAVSDEFHQIKDKNTIQQIKDKYKIRGKIYLQCRFT